MSSVDVEILINEELKNKLYPQTLNGISLPDCLIRPILENYISSSDSSKCFRLWTVLIESENGYRIFYDDEENSFGLASKSESGDLIYFANYGTFLETLKAM